VSRPPNPLPRLYRWRTNLLQVPLFFFWTSACGTLSLLISFFEKHGRIQHHIARLWARGGIFVSGSSLTVRGAENLHKHPVAVYAANHTSYMDTPVIFATLPFQFRILAKKELWPIPFIGWHLNRGWTQEADFFPASRFSARFNHSSTSLMPMPAPTHQIDLRIAIELASRIALARLAVWLPRRSSVLFPLTQRSNRCPRRCCRCVE